MKKLVLFLSLIAITSVSISQTQVYYLKNTTTNAITLNPGLGTIAAGDSLLLFSPTSTNGRIPFLKYGIDNRLASLSQLLSTGNLTIKTNGVTLSTTECFTFLANCRTLYKDYILFENTTRLGVFFSDGGSIYRILIYDLVLGSCRQITPLSLY